MKEIICLKIKLLNFSDEISVGKVNRSRLETASDYDFVNIGVLSNKKDYVADIRRKQIPDEKIWEDLRSGKNISTEYQSYRRIAGVSNIPLLLIYIIDKDSTPMRKNKDSKNKRVDLKSEEDLVGLAMLIPGIRGSHGSNRVKLKQIQESDDIGETEYGD